MVFRGGAPVEGCRLRWFKTFSSFVFLLSTYRSNAHSQSKKAPFPALRETGLSFGT
jgi:hypothetical protein